ncbi:MAG TPA: hydroxymethylglutaryl-CoA lyase [Steroidobacteraceae bacterium]|nr:hydroxymethylglutaryl-CoA lyase [Steroidobacteraceae bacterium]
MAIQVEMIEVGPRDGLQIDPLILPTATKIELIERLLACGLRRIEVTSFVNPRKVPQMADAEQVLAGLSRPHDAHFIGLVMNRKGFDRAAAAGCSEVGMVVVASDTFNRRNQGVGTNESIATWLEVADAARAAGIRAQVTISAAFGCPFEGEVPQERVIEVAQRVAEGEPHEICLADSIGVAVPGQVRELLERARLQMPGMRWRCHFHNTRNTGIANAWAAIESGVVALDASVGGIGGCPFAPAATGNIASEDLLYMLDRSGVATGVSLASLIETTKWLQQQLGRESPGLLHKAGGFPKRALL